MKNISLFKKVESLKESGNPKQQIKRKDEALFNSTDYLLVLKGISHLSPDDIDLVYMRFWENMSLLEIAEIISMPELWVEKRLSEIFKILRQFCLQEPCFSRHPVSKMAA